MVPDPTPTETLMEKLTAWVGSVPSLFLHTIAFLSSFLLVYIGYVSFDRVLLVITTIVSLEAIYLSIFIQMTVNRQSKVITEVSADVGDIQEDVEEISKDVDEIQEDVEGMTEDWSLEDGKPRTPEAVTLDALHDELKALVVRIEDIRRKS